MPEREVDQADELVWEALPAGSRRAIVAFSGADVKPGRFNYFGLRNLMPDVTQLLVRDPATCWYNAGLPGFGATVEEIADRISAKLSELEAEEVVTIGSSMGGYAAILFGCMIGARRVISFVPQTLLHPVLPIAPPAGLRLQAPDLTPVVREAPETTIDLAVGWEVLSDVFHAQRLAGSPSVRVLGVRGRHSFASELKRRGRYWPFIGELIAGETPGICEVKPPLDCDELARIEDAVFAAGYEDWQTVSQRIAPVAERNPDWVAPNAQLGRALAGLGDWEEAEAVLTSVVRASPLWQRPREELVHVLRQQGSWGEAALVIRDGLALDPQWWRGQMALGDCLLRLGRREEARSAALRAERLLRDRLLRLTRSGFADHPVSGRGNLALAEVLIQLGRMEGARSAARRAAELNPALAEAARELLGERPAEGPQ